MIFLTVIGGIRQSLFGSLYFIIIHSGSACDLICMCWGWGPYLGQWVGGHMTSIHNSGW